MVLAVAGGWLHKSSNSTYSLSDFRFWFYFVLTPVAYINLRMQTEFLFLQYKLYHDKTTQRPKWLIISKMTINQHRRAFGQTTTNFDALFQSPTIDFNFNVQVLLLCEFVITFSSFYLHLYYNLLVRCSP